MKTIRILLLGAVALCWSLAGRSQQRIADSVELAVQAIAAQNVYEVSYAVGWAGSASKQFLRFEQWVRLADVERLTVLAAHHSNAVVRLYAYQALKRKGSVPASLLEQFQKDAAQVEVLNGCNGSDRTVSSVFEEPIFGIPGNH